MLLLKYLSQILGRCTQRAQVFKHFSATARISTFPLSKNNMRKWSFKKNNNKYTASWHHPFASIQWNNTQTCNMQGETRYDSHLQPVTAALTFGGPVGIALLPSGIKLFFAKLRYNLSWNIFSEWLFFIIETLEQPTYLVGMYLSTALLSSGKKKVLSCKYCF